MIDKEILYSHQEANQHKTASLLYMPVRNSSQNLCAWTAPHYYQVLMFPRSSTSKQCAKNYGKCRPNEDNSRTPEDPWQVSKSKQF